MLRRIEQRRDHLNENFGGRLREFAGASLPAETSLA